MWISGGCVPLHPGEARGVLLVPCCESLVEPPEAPLRERPPRRQPRSLPLPAERTPCRCDVSEFLGVPASLWLQRFRVQ